MSGALSVTAVVDACHFQKELAEAPETARQVAFVRVAGWLAAAGLVVALTANVVGNVSLGEALTGLMRSQL